MRSISALLFFVSLPLLPAQDEAAPELSGGSFVIDGVQVEVSSETFARHLALIRGLNPQSKYARQLNLAWARTIRTEGARARGLELDEKAFESWMMSRHASERRKWMVAGRVDLDKFAEYLRSRGFEDRADYEAFCRDEFLGEKFVESEFPKLPPTVAEIRRRWEAVTGMLVVYALCFAHETLAKAPELNPDDLSDRALFRTWWDSVADSRKILYDDVERPAVEQETVYVRFAGHTIQTFEKFFDEDREGGSFAERTADYELTPLILGKMYERWRSFRKSHYSNINAATPDRSSDQDSFGIVRPHLEREWRMIEYLGRVYAEAKESEKSVDMKALAEKHGLRYRHLPMTPTQFLTGDRDGDGDLRSDHPLYIRRNEPGEIFRYETKPLSVGNIYYVDGPVDQPGYHASVWRLLRKEDMRVLSAEEAIPHAWDDFEIANRWRLQIERIGRFETELGLRTRLAVETGMAAVEPPPTGREKDRLEREIEARTRRSLFPGLVARTDGARLLGPFFVRLNERSSATPRLEGPLGARVANLLARDWRLIGGPEGTEFEDGQVLDSYRDAARRVQVMVRIERVVRPSEDRYARDGKGRDAAEQTLRAEREARRLSEIRRIYTYPNIVHKFSLKAPGFEAVMNR